MKLLKKVMKTGLIILIITAVPASGYALVDASAFGGYSFAGEVKNDSNSADSSGYQFGAYAHVNLGIPMILTVGAGLSYVMQPMTIKSGSSEFDATKSTLGLDAYGQLDLPFLPVLPFVRLGLAIRDDFEVKVMGVTDSMNEYFKSYYYGAGLCYSLFDFVVLDLQLFAEFIQTRSKLEDKYELINNAVNVGLKISI